jgi:hypothetical protein
MDVDSGERFRELFKDRACEHYYVQVGDLTGELMRLKARQTSSFNSTGSSGAIFIAFGHRII